LLQTNRGQNFGSLVAEQVKLKIVVLSEYDTTSDKEWKKPQETAGYGLM
jgi:hypothetical protein